MLTHRQVCTLVGKTSTRANAIACAGYSQLSYKISYTPLTLKTIEALLRLELHA